MTFENSKFAVRAAMFDLDGTLVDTVPIYYQIIDLVFAKIGAPPVSKEILLEAMKDGDFDWEVVLPAEMKPRKEALIAEARLIVDEIAPPLFREQAKLVPGADEILNAVAAGGVKLGIVTSTPRQAMDLKMEPLREAGIESLIQVIITADDVRHKKPHAEPLVKGGETLGVAPDLSVYVGDTGVDIRAGKAAGMKTVGVLTGFDDYNALKNEFPDSIIASIAQLKETVII